MTTVLLIAAALSGTSPDLSARRALVGLGQVAGMTTF